MEYIQLYCCCCCKECVAALKDIRDMMGFDPGDGNGKPFGRHIFKLDHMPTYHTNPNKGTGCSYTLSQNPGIAKKGEQNLYRPYRAPRLCLKRSSS